MTMTKKRDHLPEKLPDDILAQLQQWQIILDTVRMLWEQDMTYAEVAARLGKSEMTIRRAEDRILRVLAEEERDQKLYGETPDEYNPSDAPPEMTAEPE